MFQGLDQYVHRLFFEMNQDLLQRPLYPDDFSGDMHTDLAQGAGLVFEPLAMTLDIAQSHLLQRLFVDHCGSRQPFKIIERHDVQGGTRSFGQRGGTVEGGAVFHQRRDDQHET
ncbi:hypothetical protein D3C86_1153910 [compost metagenome]